MALVLVPERIFSGLTDTAATGCVVIDDGRIVDVDAPGPGASDTVLTLRGATLIPGLIDAHTHLSVVPSRGDQLGQLRLAADVQLATARTNVVADLLSGVTTLRIMGQEHAVDFTVRDEIASGRTLGPDLVCAGVQLAKAGNHGHALSAVEGEDDIARLVDANAARGAGLIKLFATGGVASVATPAADAPFTGREIRRAAEAAHRHGLKLAAHAHGGEGARLAIENGVDTIEHGVLLDDGMIEEVARRRLAIVGTFSIQDHPAGIQAGDRHRPEILGKLQQVRHRVVETWRRILEAGIDIAVGTDSMHGCLAFDIARLTEFGATPARALRAATIGGAAVCGLDDRGAIAPGMRADLVAVLGNPLDDIRCLGNPLLVMKAGRIVHRYGV